MSLFGTRVHKDVSFHVCCLFLQTSSKKLGIITILKKLRKTFFGNLKYRVTPRVLECSFRGKKKFPISSPIPTSLVALVSPGVQLPVHDSRHFYGPLLRGQPQTPSEAKNTPLTPPLESNSRSWRGGAEELPTHSKPTRNSFVDSEYGF